MLMIIDYQAKLPRGIEEIRPHIENVDNVPLLVSLFTESTPAATKEMVVYLILLSLLLFYSLFLIVYHRSRSCKTMEKLFALSVPQLRHIIVLFSCKQMQGRNLYILKLNLDD